MLITCLNKNLLLSIICCYKPFRTLNMLDIYTVRETHRTAVYYYYS